MTDTGTGDLVKRLRKAAEHASQVHKMMADDKSLRNGGQPGDYLWPTPEQTLEGQAADALEAAERDFNEQRAAFLDKARITDAYRAERKRDRAALEVAERVIAELADGLKAELDAEYGYKLDYPVMRAKYSRAMAPVYAARDWLARHATGQEGESNDG